MSAMTPRRAFRPMPAPPPAAVRYNDWRAIALPDTEAFMPARPVSAIVPCYQAPEALELTLAGLERQHWPPGLLEVVLVDDGSEPPLARPAATSLDLRAVRQERNGFGLARARNAGVRAAAHDILVFLDADVIPETGLIGAHARWHHAVGDALTAGFCAYVSATGLDAAAIRSRKGSVAELFAGRAFDPPWLDRHMTRTADLTSRHPDLFRAVTGGNFGISRALFEAAGGFDESFNRYGGEDTEFAYRTQVRGGLLVPARDAFGWHQGRWSDGRAGKERDMDRQADKFADLIAEPGFRPDGSRRRFAVPRHVLTLDAGEEPFDRVVRAAEALLADPAADLAVCIEVPAHRAKAAQRLRMRFPHRPRVQVAASAAAPGGTAPATVARGRGLRPATGEVASAALDAFPASPIHIRLTVATVLGWASAAIPRRVALLGSALGDAAHASAVLDDGTQVSVARAWALNRARRAGGRAADYGDTRILRARWFSATHAPGPGIGRALRPGWLRLLPGRLLRAGPHRAGLLRAAAPRGALAVMTRIWTEARHVRGPRTGWRFVRWLAAAARWRLREGRAWAATPVPGARPTQNSSARVARADAPLGARIAALGPRSRTVFAASSRILHPPRGPHGPDSPSFDVALADTPRHAADVRLPIALLSQSPALAVPAFDAALDNPIGWVRDVEPRVLALGPPRRLPAGAAARRAVAPGDRGPLLHCHHVEDMAAFHADAAERAGTLARIAARGVPVRLADSDPALPALLGAELHALMTTDIRNAGAARREALSIAQRREALRTHSLRARARQLCKAAGVEPPSLATVSVLLATHRPAFLHHAVANVARQRYPRLQLVLALHGAGFAPDAVQAALAGFEHPVKIVAVDADRPLGSVLRAASGAATGTLLSKMDDDDVYGPEHLWDLVLAHEYSGAALVGKFAASVYLQRLERTVRRRTVAGETPSRSISGGTMLIARSDLERAGGWRELPAHEDLALIQDVLRIGGSVYRTHDSGYVLVRHGCGHAWKRADAEFLAAAEAVERGWQPGLAGIGDLSPPPGAAHAIAGRGADARRTSAASTIR